MKIGLVLPSVPAYSETFFRNKILGLQQNGHEVILFVNHKKNTDTYLNCKIVTAPDLSKKSLKMGLNSIQQLFKALIFNPLKSYKLFKANQKEGLKLVENSKRILANQLFLAHQLDWLHYGFGTMALGRENVAQAIGAKMAVSFRGFDYYVYPVKNPNCYKTLFSKNVQYHVLSEGMKRGLIQHNITSSQIHKITPAIDDNLFDINSLKKEKTGDNKIIQITTTARLHWIKGLEYTLQALAILKQNNIEFQYTIIGEGTERERLMFAAHQLGIKENIIFEGKLSPAEVKKHLEKTDIYIQYSLQEGFCNAVLEAQAMGLLCIVSDAEGLSENVINNQTGWVVPKRNPQLLAQKIEEVIALADVEKEKIKENAVQRIQKEFNLHKQQQEFMNFYNS